MASASPPVDGFTACLPDPSGKGRDVLWRLVGSRRAHRVIPPRSRACRARRRTCGSACRRRTSARPRRRAPPRAPCASSALAGTVTRPRSLPLTCTTTSIASRTSASASTCGQRSSMTAPAWPSSCHSAWQACGTTGDRPSTTISSASCMTARPCALRSSNFASAFISSITAAIAVLNVRRVPMSLRDLAQRLVHLATDVALRGRQRRLVERRLRADRPARAGAPPSTAAS